MITTFIEFIMSHCLGDPIRSNGEGESFWKCWCGSDKLHSRPDHPKYKPRWACYGCNEHGDDLDLLRRTYDEPFPALLERRFFS
jgi:hypothetical protein